MVLKKINVKGSSKVTNKIVHVEVGVDETAYHGKGIFSIAQLFLL
jgi:hypothetical protein